MKLTFDSFLGDLERAYMSMKSDGLNVGLVVSTGEHTDLIGKYFANRFGCENIKVPSPNRKGRIRALSNIAAELYSHLPERALISLAELHKRIHRLSEYSCHENGLPSLLKYKDGLPILLAEDNAYTGKTLELWKRRLQEITNNEIITFSITITGDYKPDYYCIEGWRSFAWRPAGI